MNHRTRIRRALFAFRMNTRGLAAMEFALCLPLLLVLFYGSIEITRYVLIVQKVEKLANTIADVTTQSATASIASLDQTMSAGSEIMSPFSLSTNGKIIVTSLYRAAGASNATVNWRHEGGGTLNVTSQLGNVGQPPVVPGGFTFSDKENVIAAEIYFQFSPLITTQFFGTTTIYRSAFYKPRLGALTSPPT